MRCLSLACLIFCVVFMAGCGSDNSPAAPTSPLRVGSLQVVVGSGSGTPASPTPKPSPSPSPSPHPSPTPTPSPSPKPTPTPSPEPGAASTEVSVTSYVRNGTKHSGDAPSYKPGDALQLTCTVLDSRGKPTNNHGPLKNFYVGSKNLKNRVDYSFSGTNTFNPKIQIHPESKSGTIKSYCKVDDAWAPSLFMEVVK